MSSIIIFDKEDPVRDGNGGVIYPTEDWRRFLFDFTNAKPEINRYRFCSYMPYNDEGCRMCVANCSSGAQPNSVPASTGEFPEHISRQAHRFWGGKTPIRLLPLLREEGTDGKPVHRMALRKMRNHMRSQRQEKTRGRRGLLQEDVRPDQVTQLVLSLSQCARRVHAGCYWSGCSSLCLSRRFYLVRLDTNNNFSQQSQQTNSLLVLNPKTN